MLLPHDPPRGGRLGPAITRTRRSVQSRSKLADRSGRHKQVIGRLVDELEALGYVERCPEEGNRRAKLVVPTDRGREAMRLSDQIIDDIERRLAAELGKTTFEEFQQTMHAVVVSLTRPTDEPKRLLVRLDVSHRLLREALGPRALRDLKAGVRTGRFDIPDLALTLHAAGGALLGVMRAVLDGQLDDRADERHVENVLRMLGLPREEAAEIPADHSPAPPRD
jgi:DNA-binding MarR family transcriptional regulator